MRKLLLVVLLIATILIVSDNLMPDNLPIKTPVPSPITQEPQSPDESLGIVYVPEGWKLYSDSSLGFRISYPEAMEFEENGDFSVLFMPAESPAGQGQPTFFYVSVIPASQTNAEGEIYNYRREDFERLNTIALNESTSLTENRELDQWYSYTRLPDRQIAGRVAKQFANLKPWEFPAGTTETRYLFENGDNGYIVGAYFQENNASLTKQTINDMIDSFSIISSDPYILE